MAHCDTGPIDVVSCMLNTAISENPGENTVPCNVYLFDEYDTCYILHQCFSLHLGTVTYFISAEYHNFKV